MSPQEAWFNSLGIAQANSVVYTSLFFSVLMFFFVNYLNYIKKVNPKVRTIQKVAVDEAKEQAGDKASVKQFAVLREALKDGTLGFVYDVQAAYESRGARESLRLNDDRDSSGFGSINPLQHRV
jgi:hypothetical protein